MSVRTIEGIVLPKKLSGVRTDKRKIGESVWGRAWCENLERHGDFENRLPRGRTYLRNGSVKHLEVQQGSIYALVRGSRLYEQHLRIRPLDATDIQDLTERCQGKVKAALDLVRGRLPAPILESLKNPDGGLLPQPGQIEMSCSCPDWARLCKHLAAVLYGVGVRLDEAPHLLFVLRGVDPNALASAVPELLEAREPPPRRRLTRTDLASLFELELEDSPPAPRKKASAPKTPVEAPVEAPTAAPLDTDEDLTLTRKALLELGVTPAQITRALRQGELVRTEKKGVYALTPDAWVWIEELMT